jgi:hypothetical protein
LTNGLLRAIASAHNRQIAAHSTQQAGQLFLLSLPTIPAKQLPRRGRTVVAGGDTVLGFLVQMMTHVVFHVVFPLVEIGRYWRARNACTVNQRSLCKLTVFEI